MFLFVYFFIPPPPTQISTLSLHDALPIFALELLVRHRAKLKALKPQSVAMRMLLRLVEQRRRNMRMATRSEEHTSELQSHSDLVCRLLLEKKKQRLLDLGAHLLQALLL